MKSPSYYPTYLFMVCAGLILACVFGIFGPKLISSQSDEGVMLGVAMILLVPIAMLVLARMWRRTKDAKRIIKRVVPMLLLGVMLGACSKVPAGNVGVIVDLYGSNKGVSEKTVGVGRYWIGWNEELFVFPTFTQNDTWARKSHDDIGQAITFQTGRDGMVMDADFGISFHVDPDKVSTLFQTYRKGVDEISDIYLRNMVRDAINEKASAMSADEVYGKRKNELVDAVESDVRRDAAPKGIIVEKVYLIGEIRLPSQVRTAIDEKNKAYQLTLQREQEIQQAKAEADKKIAEARGTAESVLLKAKAEAEANRLVSSSITPELVKYRALDRWNGALPRMTGGAVPFVNLTDEANAK
ncbi:prohibitin family protein [Rhodopseudomonas palustris]|uniref:prohibitin family protein n=1 Tax=Rhodopseudomonas palustris TaxID=1076 RepID=UPI00069BF5D6|nr:prohibitin family protein [Rhodopseudomonas palustris]